ncbi:unnamed protein product [Meganyctiphanes norvegica]|uniref:Uncharacterized protein n=1 Tax=Meganyctiphanes norvegica TaxID=48144 RepID=A0AAV2SIH0_MEGNR
MTLCWVSKHTYTIVLEILLRDLIPIIENEIIDIRYIYCINCKHRLRKILNYIEFQTFLLIKKCIFDTLTDIYTHTYTHTHTHVWVYTHTYTYTHIHTHTYTYIHIYVCVYIPTRVYVCVRACIF